MRLFSYLLAFWRLGPLGAQDYLCLRLSQMSLSSKSRQFMPNGDREASAVRFRTASVRVHPLFEDYAR